MFRFHAHHRKDNGSQAGTIAPLSARLIAPYCAGRSIAVRCYALVCSIAYLRVCEVIEEHAEVSFTWREIKSTVHAVNVECRNMDFRAQLDHLMMR